MKVLALDLGFSMGYGVLGSDKRYWPLSGSRKIKGSSTDMGEAFRSLCGTVMKLVNEHHPDMIVIAYPFVVRNATPTQMTPIFGWPSRLQELVEELGIPLKRYYESDARRHFLGSVPRKSKDIKAAVMQGCRDRGWPATDDHAADALCMASFALAQAVPSRSHETAPLFIRARKRRKVAA